MNGAARPRSLSFMGALHTVRGFEAIHLYDPAQMAEQGFHYQGIGRVVPEPDAARGEFAAALHG